MIIEREREEKKERNKVRIKLALRNNYKSMKIIVISTIKTYLKLGKLGEMRPF